MLFRSIGEDCILENVKKNYKRVIVLLLIATLYLIGLYVVFTYFDDAYDDISQDGFALALFGGFILIGVLIIYLMMYIYVILGVLALVFATIARFTYKGEPNKLSTYRGFMITTYVFLIIIDVCMLLFSGTMAGIIGFLLAIGYTVFLVINMRATFKSNVVDYPANYAYYNPNMYYNQNVNYNNQAYDNQNYNNQNYT